MKKAAVVIPTYKSELSELEKISLQQVLKIFKKYDIFFVLPQSLHYSYEVEYIKEIRYEDIWFKDIQGYNRLLMDEKFYISFIDYRYILIYQLDAFVFEDKLEYFCDLGYDYIGAPWLSGMQYVKDNKYFVLHVGNGGFSLRNVDKCLKLIKQRSAFFLEDINEDIFYSMGNSDDFRVAPLETALQFAFEREVERCFILNKNKLPFGCHAWERYDIECWKPWIEQYGYKLDEKYLCKGNEDFILMDEYENQRKISDFVENIYSESVLRNFINKKDKKIYIWGAGNRGRLFGSLLSEAGINIEGYLDNKTELKGTFIGKFQVLSLEEYKKNKKNAYVIVAVDACKDEIARQLYEMECRYEQDYIFYKDIFEIISGHRNNLNINR